MLIGTMPFKPESGNLSKWVKGRMQSALLDNALCRLDTVTITLFPFIVKALFEFRQIADCISQYFVQFAHIPVGFSFPAR
ncbi:MAG: hypothetical protein PUD80_09005, partial [Firmicutes bacterium]|nr:hypothetical protein [Bacillota bacterium]